MEFEGLGGELMVPEPGMKVVNSAVKAPLFDTVDITIVAVILGTVFLIFLPSLIRRIRNRKRGEG